MQFITRAFLKSSDNLLDDRPARVEGRMLFVSYNGKEYAYQITTKAMVMNKPRKILGKFHIPFTGTVPIAYYLVDLKCPKTLEISEYQVIEKTADAQGKEAFAWEKGDNLSLGMPPDALSKVLDFEFLKALAQKATQGMMILMLIAGLIGGLGAGYVVHDYIDSQNQAPATTVIATPTVQTGQQASSTAQPYSGGGSNGA